MKTPMTPNAYAAAVREALADLPAGDREALLEDLDDHLAEIAAESGVPLEDRLGSPEAYAAELRAAYGGRTRDADLSVAARVGRRVTGIGGAVHARLLRLPPYRQAAAFLPDLRPAWWVLRGYVIAIGVLAQFPTPGYLPDDLAEWVFTLAVIWCSVWLGRAARTGPPMWGRLLLLGGNTLAAFLVLVALANIRQPTYVALDRGSPRPAGPVWVENVSGFGQGDVYNIFPYAEDGTPLRNVRLYDQDGRPITLNPEMYDQRIAIPCEGEPPIRNAYPLPLTPATMDDGSGMPVPADCVPSAEMPTPTAVPSPDGTSGVFPSPTSEATPEPSSEPSSEPTPEPAPSKSPGKNR